MIRDQANKTIEIFLHRVRTYAQSMPDTVLTSIDSSAQANQPRMGTTQSEGSSWAGWAISSFTNKITSVSGQMDEKSSAPQEQRPNSVPPASSGLAKPVPSTTSLKGLHPSSAKSTKPNPFAPTPSPSATPEPEAAFDNSWDEADNAWGEDEDPFSPKAESMAPVEKVDYDDKGEPDFEGWLNAQANAKKGPKKPLPKGLAKTNLASRPSLTKSHSTGGSALKKPTATKPPTLSTKKKEEPKAEEEDDAWGDAWD